MSTVRFVVSRQGLYLGNVATGESALARAWRAASEVPGTPVHVRPVGRGPVLELAWKNSRVDCRSVATGRRLTYAGACDVLAAVPDGL